VGDILFLGNTHHFTMKYGAKTRFNNKAELYVLWIMLKIRLEHKVKNIYIMGDSKLLID